MMVDREFLPEPEEVRGYESQLAYWDALHASVLHATNPWVGEMMVYLDPHDASRLLALEREGKLERLHAEMDALMQKATWKVEDEAG